MSTTDVIVDIAGYVPAGSPVKMLPTPVRFADTREPGNRAGIRLRAGETRSVRVAGTSGVPADAAAVVFNATAVDPDRDGYLTVFPCGRPIPATSTLNFTRGAVVPNLVTSAVGAGGAVCFSAIADVDVVADVSAYIPSGSPGVTLLPAPDRILDTRTGLGGAAGTLSSVPRPVQVVGRSGVPSGATAAIVNLTATEGTGAGFVSASPCGSTPLVSNLNFTAGQSVANAAIVKLAPDGTMCLRSNVAVHGVVDITGYLTSSEAIVPVDPRRVGDTREDAAPICNLGIVRNGDSWQWIDLANGGLGAVFANAPAVQGTWKLDISVDCATALVVTHDTLFVVDRRGVTVRSSPLPRGASGRDVFAGDWGALAVEVRRTPGVARSLIALDTNEVLIDYVDLEPDLGWTFAGAARDQSVYLFFTTLADSTKEFRVLDFDGFEVARFRLPPGADFFSVSPSGVYMSYGLRVMRGGSETVPEMHVVTVGGDPVEVRPTTIGGETHARTLFWLSDGRGVGCSRPGPDGSVTARYDLFAPARRTGMPCVSAAL